jgi:hypothetical protein
MHIRASAYASHLRRLVPANCRSNVASGGRPLSERHDELLIERIQAEVQEIAEVLSTRSGKSIADVWNEALTLHRVRYETEVLLD